MQNIFLLKDRYILFYLIAIALIIRFWNIDANSIWVDEGASIDFAMAPFKIWWPNLLISETNPPGYYFILKIWIYLFGFSDFSIRSLSAITSSLVVLPLYFLSKLVLKNKILAIAVCVIYLLSAQQVYFAQEARTFAHLTLLYVTAMFFAANICNHSFNNKLTSQHLYLIFSCALIPYFHLTGIFIIAAIFIYIFSYQLLTGKFASNLRINFLSLIIIFFLVLPILILVIYQLTIPNSPAGWIPRPSFVYALNTFLNGWGFGFLDFLHPMLKNVTHIFLVGLSIFILLNAIFINKDSHVLSIGLSILFVGLTFTLVSLIKPFLLTRTIVFMSPLIILFIISGIKSLPKSFIFLIIFSFILSSTVNLMMYYSYLKKEPWKTLINEASINFDNDMAILHIGGGSEVAFLGGGPVMVQKYWIDKKPKNQYFVTDGGSQLDNLIPDLHSEVKNISPKTKCKALESYSELRIISRREVENLRILRSYLTDYGSEEIEFKKYGSLIFERWTKPNCY